MRQEHLIKIIAFLIILSLGFSIGQAQGADWSLFAVSLDGKIEDYYDRATVAFPAPGVVRVTTKTIKYTSGEPEGKTKILEDLAADREGFQIYAHTITQHQIECRNHRVTILSSSDYDQRGKLVHHSEEPWVLPRLPYRRTPQEIYPESVSESLFKLVCPPVPGSLAPRNTGKTSV